MRKLQLFILSLPLLVLSVSGCSHADGYAAHVLSSPAGSRAFAFDMNDSGQIVGGINGGDPYMQRAMLWNSYSSGPQSLDEGNRSPSAQLINNAGLVVGEHESPLGSTTPFRWSANSGVTTIVPFVPESLNESGTMVGWKSASDIQQVPVVVSSTGEVTYLDYTCGNGGIARDINDSGYIVGDSRAPVWGGHATLWHEGDTTLDLGTFDGTWSHAVGINNAGQVVGVYGGDNGAIGNFIWSKNNDTVFIPSYSLFDYGCFAPLDINDNGVVLGGAEINGVHTVVTWSQAGGFTVVGEGIAKAINNSGWIVGISDLNNSQAIVWEPVPEPSSLLVLGLGVVSLVRGSRRTRRRRAGMRHRLRQTVGQKAVDSRQSGGATLS